MLKNLLLFIYKPDTPQGTLNIVSIDNTAFIMPRVSQLEDVTDGAGSLPLEGTMIYDNSRNSTYFYQNSKWICIEDDSSGNPVLVDETPLKLLLLKTLQSTIFANGF